MTIKFVNILQKNKTDHKKQKRSIGGYSILELMISVFITSILLSMNLPTLKNEQFLSPKILARRINRLLDYISMSSYLSNYNYEAQVIDNSFQVSKIEDNIAKHISSIEIPKTLNLQMKFGTISDTPNLIHLWANGKATPGTIKIHSINRNDKRACFIYQSIYGARRIECNYSS